MLTKDITETNWNFENSYLCLPDSFYTRITPSPVRSPSLVLLNKPLLAELGMNAAAFGRPEEVAVLAGNRIPPSSIPIAQAYAGHQFGYFTMLGDGRALLLGELITPHGDRVDVQLKGSGRTPYSRGGDGRAALGPMLREYIISEAMVALGIPTTRSLAVVTTGETIRREKSLPGAVLTRIASSHIRVGTFQYAAKWCSRDDLKALADYTLDRHFPGYESEENRYLYLLRQVIIRQAALIAKWQLVGFIHGVMNTDNMALSGETIDYGPCAFMDTYNPDTVFSSIDVNGRYAYGNQPDIAGWNLTRFAETLLPLLHENRESAIEQAQQELSAYNALYETNWLDGMRAKLGLFNVEEQDAPLISKLLDLMAQHQADYTNTFLSLTSNRIAADKISEQADFMEWYRLWTQRLTRQQPSQEDAVKLMRRSNPAVIPRNHRVEEALAAAGEQDYSVMEELLKVLAHPYAHTPEQQAYAEPPQKTACGYKTFCGT